MSETLLNGLLDEAQLALLVLGMSVLAVALHKITRASAGWYFGLTVARFRLGLFEGACDFVRNDQLVAVQQRPDLCLILHGAGYVANFGMLATMVVMMVLKGHAVAHYFCFAFAGTNLLVLLLALKPGSSFNQDLDAFQAAWHAAQAESA